MKRSWVYFGLCVVGVLLPYAQFVPFLMEHGFAFGLIVDQLFVNRISSFFVLDVLVSAVVLIFVVYDERKRLGVLWFLPIFGSLLVGVSLGLPLFLFLKERMVEKEKAI
jgi:hypothetical protein